MTGSSSAQIGRSTLWGGVLIGVAAVSMLFDRAGTSIAIDDTYSFPLWGTIARAVTGIVLLVGFIVMASGRRRGTRVTGTAPYGPAALIVFGAVTALGMIVSALTDGHPVVRSTILVVIRIVVVVAGFVAAAAVTRARSADRSTQLMLTVTAFVLLASTLFQLVPVPMGVAVLFNVLFALALLGLAVTLVLDGRHEQVQRRLELIRKNW
ncbi:hypothetical protein [Curtobacterium sp. Leaf261]|uniref:hypothetical protein n=1 Tax=Curtobacterium sp. Leaf261 TaxID=1736311 RepID=UPI0006FC75F4|nr:hypothetical protein [Curtobacterium sp. Leaf261]KQO62332.1 hypothetical protein ASF23_11085 [Curtobacterium sp. Leaf261]